MIAAFVLTLLAVAIAILVALCATGKIHRNPIAGIRIPSLFTSDETWIAGHRAALLPTTIAAAICAVMAIFVITVPSLAESGMWAILIVLLAGLLVGSMLAGRAARALTRG